MKADDFEQLQIFETHLQTTLKHSIHISINNKHHGMDIATKLKPLYSLTLKSQIKRDDFVEFSYHLRNALNAIRDAAVIQ